MDITFSLISVSWLTLCVLLFVLVLLCGVMVRFFVRLFCVAALFINKNARMPQSRSVDRIPASCIGCNRHLAVWCHCYSVATRALGLCISCLRCRDVEVCWNCKKAPRRSGVSFGGCCAQCASLRRCSICDFFEYAPGHPGPGCVCPRCQAPFKCAGCVSCGLISTRMIVFYTYLVFE